MSAAKNTLLKKAIAGVLIAGTLISICACPRRSGKPYLDEHPEGHVADGIIKSYEINITANFLCYTDKKGKTMLAQISRDGYEVDPDGLCDVKPGNIYKIRYDIQYISGGIAGGSNHYFLCVYDCKEIEAEQLFEEDYFPFAGHWDNDGVLEQPMYSHINDPYIVVNDYGGEGYIVYSKRLGKLHFDEFRELEFPIQLYERDEPDILQLNVICNRGVTDEQILAELLSGEPSDGTDFLFYDTCSEYIDNLGNSQSYDSFDRIASGKFYMDHCVITSSEEPQPGRKHIITYDDLLSGKTAAELGLPGDIYDQIYENWDTLTKERTVRRQIPHYDVILFDGPFGYGSFPEYDSTLKIYLTTNNNPAKEPQPDDNYVAVFVRHEFIEAIPQI